MKLPNISDSLLLRITIAIWALAYLGLCARTLVKVEKSSVYPDFSSAGDHWIHGNDLYVRGGKNEFRYSPLVAAFFVPFDLLPNRVGEFLWRSLNFCVFLAGLYYCCKADLPMPLSLRQRCGEFLLCIPLAIGSLNNAQSNPLVLGLLLFAAGTALRRRWSICCIAITLATCFKLYPIAFGMLLALMYPRKMIWRLMVCLVAAAVLPFVLQHATYVMDQYSVWVHYLSTEDRQRGPIADWYKDFRALWRVYIMPMRPLTYLIIEVLTAAMIALTCLIARLKKMPDGMLVAFTLSLACCWMTVMGPATESPTYILVAPAIAWALIWSDAKPSARVWRIGYGCVLALFIACQAALWFGRSGKFFRDHLQPLPLAGLLLLVLIWVEMVNGSWRCSPGCTMIMRDRYNPLR
jgi:hypothetical protein